MTHMQLFQGTSSDGSPISAVYAERQDADIAFALAFPGNDLPRFVYWGRPISAPETVLDMIDATRPQRVSGALDFTAWPSILPTQSESWLGQPRFEVRRDGVELMCKFAVSDIATDHDTVSVTASDDELGVQIVWQCTLDRSGLVLQHVTVTNLGSGNLEVGKIELGMPVPAYATEILTTTGHHLRERSPQRQPLTVGRFQKASLVGRPDFDASLLLSVGEPGFGFTHGDVYSVHVAWSGNSVLSAERLPYTSGLIGGGEFLFGGEMTLARGESYTTPDTVGSYGTGLNEVASRFHTFLRNTHREWCAEHGIERKPRPVILNTWEAVYFQHDYDTLTALADKAAEVGVERFVVDDGWFGSRRDDTSGLGDWQISPEVWPEGDKSLKALADYVHGKGMEFGLWFEPEMVNPDSDMFRNHPDWVLRPAPGRLPMQGRTQQVVDLTNPDAYAYVFNAMNDLVERLGIDYIKWDHNKMVTESISPRTGRPATHEQTLAVYRIFSDLKNAHPGLEIESCSSGGGRIDLGILQVADRVWASDCVDPVERADIQRYTSLLVPPEMIGEHVGDSPAHSTQRATSLEMRMAMAFFGHMGVEWNLLKQPQEEIEMLRQWIEEFKLHRDMFASGLVIHGDDQDGAVRLDGVVSADRKHAIYRFTQLTTSQTYPAATVRLPGLDAQALYGVKPMGVSYESGVLGETRINNAQSALGWWTPEGVTLTGQALGSYTGIRPPSLHPAQAVLIEVNMQ